MFQPMLTITKKYVKLAINCNTVVMATFLHPAWQTMLFSKSFDEHTSRITNLINKKFKECKTALELLKPSSPEPKETQSDPKIDAAPTDKYSDGKEYDFFQETFTAKGVVSVTTPRG
jgi:hypothetical protein